MTASHRTRASAAMLALVGLGWGATGCSFALRSPKMYREDTRTLLATREADVKVCYDQVLKEDPDASGTVVVGFVVEPETGKLTGVSPAASSTAPESLQNCVVNALEGLTLEPPDQKEGLATFTYEFQKNPAAPAAADGAPGEAPPG